MWGNSICLMFNNNISENIKDKAIVIDRNNDKIITAYNYKVDILN